MARLSLPSVAASWVLFLLDASAAAPTVHALGGERGWAVPPSGRNGATTEASSSFEQWAESRRFHVGDVLEFKYANDSVLLVRRGDYEQCATASAVMIEDGDSSTRFTLRRPGSFFFISGAPGHCEAGQRLAVRVVVVDAARSAPVAAQAPVTNPPPSGTPPATGATTGRPAVVVLKLMPSFDTWVLTVLAFLVITMGLLAFCVRQQSQLVDTFIEARMDDALGRHQA
ncbi:hypothetical protein QOZ80_6BG0492030 [Eleusine coracana subsp. coracana]|nr:hypothetical protein QOZ80_6BG0492030 [Eleusine coracana subsp. coracana]